MNRKRVITEDGAHSFYVEELDEHYHSIYGAIQESETVFIEGGLKHRCSATTGEIRILEVGFGTGLNALLTLRELKVLGRSAHYTTLEAYPISMEDAAGLNFCDEIHASELKRHFLQMHKLSWEVEHMLTNEMTLKKLNLKLQDYESDAGSFDIIYFDAFAPSAQPELWTETIFELLFKSLVPEGVLVTYCAKGSVKRAMKSAGFKLEALPGPKNKREMTRAIKPG